MTDQERVDKINAGDNYDMFAANLLLEVTDEEWSIYCCWKEGMAHEMLLPWNSRRWDVKAQKAVFAHNDPSVRILLERILEIDALQTNILNRLP